LAPLRRKQGPTTKQERKNVERRKREGKANQNKGHGGIFKSLRSFRNGDFIVAHVGYKEVDDGKARVAVFLEAVDRDTARVQALYSQKRACSRRIRRSSGRESYLEFEPIDIPRVHIRSKEGERFDESKFAESDYEFIDGLLSDLLSHSAMPNEDKFAREQFEHLKLEGSFEDEQIRHLEERFTELSKQSDTTRNIVAEETAERRLRYSNQLQARAIGDAVDPDAVTLDEQSFAEKPQDPKPVPGKRTKGRTAKKRQVKRKKAQIRAENKRAKRSRRKLS